MLKIGVTGNIGAGKTQICSIFELLSIPVYYADQRAKSLMETGAKLEKELIHLFGKKAYQDDGSLNRKLLSSIVFNDESKLQALNKLVHPAVAIDFEEWANVQNSPYVVKEAALLFEAGSYKLMDYNILVTADLSIRIGRVMGRDKLSEKEVIQRENRQMKQEQKIKLADFVINNNGDSAIVKEVLRLHKRFIES